MVVCVEQVGGAGASLGLVDGAHVDADEGVGVVVGTVSPEVAVLRQLEGEAEALQPDPNPNPNPNPNHTHTHTHSRPFSVPPLRHLPRASPRAPWGERLLKAPHCSSAYSKPRIEALGIALRRIEPLAVWVSGGLNRWPCGSPDAV